MVFVVQKYSSVSIKLIKSALSGADPQDAAAVFTDPPHFVIRKTVGIFRIMGISAK